jgi:hypothetical protein
MSIPELLISDGFITLDDRKRIENLSAKTGQSFIKIALNFGYISRKNYERILANADYNIEQVRTEAFDTEVLKKIDLKFADEHIAMPLRIEDGRVVTIMADPTNELFVDFIKFTYNCEPRIIVASDLDILWLSHKLLGEKYVKSSVYELMNNDPGSSAIVTFTTAQLIFAFVLLGIALKIHP